MELYAATNHINTFISGIIKNKNYEIVFLLNEQRFFEY